MDLADDNITTLFETLTDREDLVLRRYFGLSGERRWTLAEIGRDLGVSRERVGQIRSRALRKLHRPTGANLLKRYLALLEE